jgi:hypothetical protein
MDIREGVSCAFLMLSLSNQKLMIHEERIIKTKNYIFKISTEKIKPGDTIISINFPDQVPRKVRQQWIVNQLLPDKRKIIAHKPLGNEKDSPVLEGVPLMN